jgi:DNA-binding transcriptional regulator YdaS (Cro superfamily)
MSKRRDKIVDEAIATAGGLERLGLAIGITAQAVWKWTRVPANRVIAVERATGIPRERLRPDIFGAPRPHPRGRKIRAAEFAA